jgi:type I restriction enzyme R subunit
MAINTTERTFEQEIEWCLLNENGYIKGSPTSYDRVLAMDTAVVIAFVKDTQPKEWAQICKNRSEDSGAGFLSRLKDELSKRGMIDVLRHGIVDLGVTVRLCYFKPGSGMNQTAMAQYDKNILQVTRQVKYSLANENSIDTVIFLNGLPIITMELKNPLTGQTFQNAITQYKNDRAPNEPLLKFGKRALVHFAMDTDEIWMTTKLNRQDTTFILLTVALIRARATLLLRAVIAPPISGVRFCNGIAFLTSSTALFR